MAEVIWAKPALNDLDAIADAPEPLFPPEDAAQQGSWTVEAGLHTQSLPIARLNSAPSESFYFQSE
jgi:hypothetical protein